MSRAITRDELPTGTGVFQRTFSPGPNATGRPVSSDMPDAFDPRNWGQSRGAHMDGPSVLPTVRLLNVGIAF